MKDNTLYDDPWYPNLGVIKRKYCNEHNTLLKPDGTCELCQEEYIQNKNDKSK